MESNILHIDNQLNFKSLEEDAVEVKELIETFTKSYIKHKDDMPVDEWLKGEFKKHLPDYNDEELTSYTNDIITTIKLNDEKLESIDSAVADGKSKEQWFEKEVKNAISRQGMEGTIRHLSALGEAVSESNQALLDIITTQNGAINQNPNLDGFIAEQYHTQTFNLNAKARGSEYRAHMLESTNKNSVDVVIKGPDGKIAKKYQSKFSENQQSTEKLFQKGDYRGQRKLVPDGQQGARSTNVIEAPDGTTSNPLTKARAKEMQNEAQSGNWNDLNWNEYKTADLAKGVGKQAGKAALLGAGIGIGTHIVKKKLAGEQIEADEIIEDALVTGADFGVKAAVGGALKVGAEKGIIKLIPKGTPAATVANIAFVAIENVKVMGEMARGDIGFVEGLEKMERVSVSCAAGLIASAKGMTVGASAGMVLGPVGAAVGGFVGGVVGYMAGSKVGEVITNGAQKVRRHVASTVKSIGESVKSGAAKVFNSVKGLFAW